MTEEEAKAKWCPMVRPGNAQRADDFGCIGSACMMWRWHKARSWSSTTTADKPEVTDSGPRLVPQRPTDDYRWKQVRPKDGKNETGFTVWIMDGVREHGYCGLAHEPDILKGWNE